MNPKGWATMDYEAEKHKRKSLWDYLSANKIPDSTPITKFSVMTANFGGIYTEPLGVLYPYNGTVSAEAARSQVEAGARAMVLDIWPDPANPRMPVVAAMVDTDEWPTQKMWKNNGLNAGVGKYSNWQLLTRNVGNVNEIVKAAMDEAFLGAGSNQTEDPFFLVFNLHGAMTTEYLNYLGGIVQKAIGGHAMGAEWNKAANQSKFCQTAISTLRSKVVIIVNPDVQPGYKSLPGINTIGPFTEEFLKTKMGEITNVLTTQDRPVVFQPANYTSLTTATQPNCASGNSTKQTLPQTGLCVIQPSIGATSTDNDDLYTGDSSFEKCFGTSAQMVAVNLFSQNTSDKVLGSVFSDEYFGTYSWLATSK